MNTLGTTCGDRWISTVRTETLTDSYPGNYSARAESYGAPPKAVGRGFPPPHTNPLALRILSRRSLAPRTSPARIRTHGSTPGGAHSPAVPFARSPAGLEARSPADPRGRGVIRPVPFARHFAPRTTKLSFLDSSEISLRVKKQFAPGAQLERVYQFLRRKVPPLGLVTFRPENFMPGHFLRRKVPPLGVVTFGFRKIFPGVANPHLSLMDSFLME